MATRRQTRAPPMAGPSGTCLELERRKTQTTRPRESSLEREAREEPICSSTNFQKNSQPIQRTPMSTTLAAEGDLGVCLGGHMKRPKMSTTEKGTTVQNSMVGPLSSAPAK